MLQKILFCLPVLLVISFPLQAQDIRGLKSGDYWEYEQRTGEMWHPNLVVINVRNEDHGYSGKGEGRNNPKKEAEKDVGPIPAGLYRIGPAYDNPKTGPHVMDLTPIGHNAHGRSGFQIHGDKQNHDASTGCIVLAL